ncbi:hypothetical protein BN77_1385 [Rhizobium mesoamericanum STM3625]|uniref:Uncharacterized protein n=1 Tax=Rhizobium mesoamericanum STM3625 TaxID=1211777 RepID=K0PT08_9HYPH|nr:hypothetical protein BN77_1385 [Rhizobium mesoamericanum STM3625]
MMEGMEALPIRPPTALLHDKELAVALVARSALQCGSSSYSTTRGRAPHALIPFTTAGQFQLVKRFCEGCFGITSGFGVVAPDGEEGLGMFKRDRTKSFRGASFPRSARALLQGRPSCPGLNTLLMLFLNIGPRSDQLGTFAR